MTAFFVEKMHATLKCRACKKLAADNRKFCPKHLATARDKWRRWSAERRDAGLCCYCDRKSYKGHLRCRAHTLYNREVCNRWWQENAEHKADYDQQRVENWVAVGRCPACKPHRKLDTGFRRCKTCRRRHRQADKARRTTRRRTRR